MTYTCAKLPISKAAYDEIAKKLREAGYDHVFSDEGIDMTHIMVEAEEAQDLTCEPRTAEDEALRSTIISDIVAAEGLLRWCRYRVLNSRERTEMFRGGLGTYVVGVTKLSNGQIFASIRDDVTQTLLQCNPHLSNMLYNQALEALNGTFAKAE